jgi:hypothetical protein
LEQLRKLKKIIPKEIVIEMKIFFKRRFKVRVIARKKGIKNPNS